MEIASTEVTRTAVVWLFMVLLALARIVVFIVIAVLLIRALLKYLGDKKATPEQQVIRKSLGEVLKDHRQRCQMTQEFVAESLGVSRQAVSKWESGASDPSTSNLLALARLFGISPEELLKSVQEPKQPE